MKNSKRLIQGLFSSTLATALSFLLTFFLTPYMTKVLGTEAYGFVAIAKNFAGYAMIITTALNSYAARYVALQYHNQKYKEANRYFSSVFWGDALISFVIFLFSLIAVIYLQFILVIPNELIISVKILFLITFINFSLSTLKTVFPTAFYISNRIDVSGYINSLTYIIEIVTLILLFRFANPQLWYVSLGSCVATCVAFYIQVKFCKKLTPELRIKREYVSLNAIKELVFNGMWNAFNSLGNMLNSGLDLIVSNLMLSTLSAGQLAITKTLSMVFNSFNQIIAQPFQPLFLKSYANNDKQQLLSYFRLSMKTSGMLSNIIFGGYIAYGLAFLKLWIPEQNIFLIHKLMILTMIALAPEGLIYPLYYIYTLTIKNKLPCIITIIGGLLNVIGMYFLIRYTDLGVYAVPLTTAIIMTVINFVTNPLYMCYCLHIKWYSFYPTIIRNIISTIMISFVFSIINYTIEIDNWVALILVAGFSALAGGLIHILVVFDKTEKHVVWGMFQQKIHN